MRRPNVDLVLGIYPAPDVDFVDVLGDGSLWAEWAEAAAPFIHADFECVNHAFDNERRYVGLDGLRAFMVDWTAPWVSYRVETEDVIDIGDRVLLLNRDAGRRPGSMEEIRGRMAALWTIRDGKVARLDAYPDRDEGLKAVGMSE